MAQLEELFPTPSLAACHRAEFLGWLSLPLDEKRSDLNLYLDALPAAAISCPGLAGHLAWACNQTSVPHSSNRLSYFHYLNLAPPGLSPPVRRFFVYSVVAALGTARAERYKPPGKCLGLAQLRWTLEMIARQRGGLQCCLKTISWQGHISASYLAALFNTVVGVTYREYVKSVRLSCAAESMRRPKARIAEVSSSLGYTEPSNFVRDFRCGFGVCPAKWRGSYSDDFLWPHRVEPQ
jgi:AraC-like DNA-binding protein